MIVIKTFSEANSDTITEKVNQWLHELTNHNPTIEILGFKFNDICDHRNLGVIFHVVHIVYDVQNHNIEQRKPDIK